MQTALPGKGNGAERHGAGFAGAVSDWSFLSRAGFLPVPGFFSPSGPKLRIRTLRTAPVVVQVEMPNGRQRSHSKRMESLCPFVSKSIIFSSSIQVSIFSFVTRIRSLYHWFRLKSLTLVVTLSEA